MAGAMAEAMAEELNKHKYVKRCLLNLATSDFCDFISSVWTKKQVGFFFQEGKNKNN